MRAYLYAAGLVLMGLQPAPGEGLRALVTANDTKGWEAVGRIDIGPSGFCTGALIGEDLVLTAAHCLFDPVSRARIPDGEIRFLAGFRNGRATADRGVRATVVHPDYAYTGPQSAEHVTEDIALIELDRPIRMSSVAPFGTDRQPRKGEEVQVVSYAHNRASRPSIEEACHILGRPAGALVMSCDVDFGSSGSPVFATDDDGTVRIVSVISAKALIGGRRVSLGTRLDAILPDLVARLGEEERAPAPEGPVVRHVSQDGRPSQPARSGAKFLRP